MRRSPSSYMDSVTISWFSAFCLAISFISCFHEVYGRNSLPTEDILEQKEHVSFNYTHVKFVKTQYGDIYDCVELYKQPALQHPLLKGHKIQMRPTFSQQNKVSEKGAPSKLRFGLKKECPSGTVPIRRTTKEEQFQAKVIFRQQFQGPKFSNGQQDRFAGLSSTAAPDYIFNLAEGYISTHNPNVGKGQLSASMISVESGQPGSTFGTIRAGWMVYPDLYNGDNHTRLYTSWGQFNNTSSKGCFNTYCSGFVQVSKKIPVDMVIEEISVPAGEYSYIKLRLRQSEDWWLTYGEDDEKVGYWPNALFNGLANGGNVIRWGGWVSSTTQALPMMGSGLLGNLGSQFRCIVSNDIPHSLKQIRNDEQYQVEQSKCYRAKFNSYEGKYWGVSFWYGGSGGDVQQCPLN